ncbi:MAG: DUF1848 domain-containing protein [Ruminococcus sp.]|nr:DUF1848 domain-containing protein [Ruminococcus sp.]
MLINTGMRTDIPAFYSEWFVNRLRTGFVLVRNPYRSELITRYELDPEVVDCIAFCTKDPSPMLPLPKELNAFKQYWFVTITPYGKDIEPNVPPKEKVMQDFISLSRALGTDCVGWRYDPILIDSTYTIERHISDFEQMCALLAGYTRVCVISFIDLYEKVKRNFPKARTVSRQERAVIAETFCGIAGRYGITVKGCAEGQELERYGVDCSGCMTKETFEKAVGSRLIIPKRKSQREECGCVLGSDIGAYDTCGHLCRYCYANCDAQAVKRNMALHDPQSPLLTGNVREGDVIHQAKQLRWTDDQLCLF